MAITEKSGRRRYQQGSLNDNGDRWIIRWREDVIDPQTRETKRVRRSDWLWKKDFPTEKLARRQLDKIVAEANGKEVIAPAGLRAVEALLCESCRERLLAALSAAK